MVMQQLFEEWGCAGPAQAPTMVEGTYPPAFPLKHQQKDMRLALEEASEAGLRLPMAAAANNLYMEVQWLSAPMTCSQLTTKSSTQMSEMCEVCGCHPAQLMQCRKACSAQAAHPAAIHIRQWQGGDCGSHGTQAAAKGHADDDFSAVMESVQNSAKA